MRRGHGIAIKLAAPKSVTANGIENEEEDDTMKKRIVFALTVFFALTAAAGCGSASKENGGASESGGTEDSLAVFVEEDGSKEDSQDGYGYGAGLEEDFGYDEDVSGESDSDGGYQSYKDVYRDCNDAVNTAISRFFELFDTDFYDSDAVTYHQYMTYYGSFCSPFEDIFSGNDKKIEKGIKEGFYAEDIAWSVDGGFAVITFTAEDENVTVTVEYDGSQTAQIIYTAGGEITQRASFITNDRYDIIAYSYSTMTVIDAVYANGDAYYIYDPSGSSVDFSVYNGSFDDPSELIGDRSYIAIIDGALVY